MFKSLIRTGLVIAATLVLSRPVCASDVPKRIDVILEDHPRWEIALVKGEIGFIGGWTPVSPGAGKTQSPVEISAGLISRGVFRNDDTLQAYVSTLVTYVDPKERDKVPKVQAERHHWYLTGDYSGKEPALKLTKKMEKYSHWEFVPVGEPTGREDHEPVQQYFIRNLNDLGKDAWLNMEKTPGVRYVNVGEYRKAILSSERQGFSVPLGATGK